jgi:addiction module HigA family antidote
MLPKSRPATHPGEILNEEFLKPLGISQNAFAAHLDWPHAKINEIIHGRRGITPEAALSLADVLGTTPDLWLNLQKNYDLSKAQRIHRKKKPFLAKAV